MKKKNSLTKAIWEHIGASFTKKQWRIVEEMVEFEKTKTARRVLGEVKKKIIDELRLTIGLSDSDSDLTDDDVMPIGLYRKSFNKLLDKIWEDLKKKYSIKVK